LHLNENPTVRDDNHLSTEPSFDAAIWPFDHESHRRDLRKMTESELIEESQISSPRNRTTRAPTTLVSDETRRMSSGVA
jgi:hypothetical protein